MQQAGKLYNARKCDKGNPSAYLRDRLFSYSKSMENKWWARRVPAAAVTPAPRVVVAFIGSKAFVVGSLSLL